MGSEDDRDKESGQSRSEFGPPVGDFGPPVGDFGAPVNDFGAPVGDFGPPVDDFGGPPLDRTGPGWSVPSAPDQPDLGWRPAGEVAPPSTPTYRAPEPQRPQQPAPADFGPEVTAEPSSAATTRYQTPPVASPSADASSAATTRYQTAPPTDTSTAATTRYQTAPPADASTTRYQAAPADEPEPRWSGRDDYNLDDDEPAPSRASSSSSLISWDDDPIAQRLAPGASTTKPPAKNGRGRWIMLGAAGILAVVIGLVATVIALNRNPGGDEDGKPTAAPPLPSTTAALNCPATTNGDLTTGNGVGNTTSGTGAILGFQYGFYVERSGEKAREYVAPDAPLIATADHMQTAINNEIPRGTTHCLRILAVGPDTYSVDLTTVHPNSNQPIVYPQTVTTVIRDGKTLVYTIEKRAGH
ncbi:hypothetical protein ACFVMC_01040 [Nocardia sp. NPDC127579]|uniref:hypothetical protein n=1 Tax=Nocardia sp. NPDC127579 TaxID=3345402 RepID=UPI0036454517